MVTELILHKDWPTLVTPILFKDLDKSKCSNKFLDTCKDFDPETPIYVKCHSNGTLDFREKRNKQEYRIVNGESVVKLPDYYDVNFKTLVQKYDKEFTKYSSYITSDVNKANAIVKRHINKIAKLNFNLVAVELCPTNAVKFTLRFEGEKIVMISKPFTDADDIPKEIANTDYVIFSIFINKKHIMFDVTDIDNLVDGLTNYLKGEE